MSWRKILFGAGLTFRLLAQGVSFEETRYRPDFGPNAIVLSWPGRIRAADFDRDGRSDLVIQISTATGGPIS
jgi:hypothetical protein